MMSGNGPCVGADAGTWLAEAARVPSPNFDDRPDGEEISLLVLHSISLPEGCYGGGEVEALFTNCLCAGDHPGFAEIASLKVSAHLFIRRDGSLLQFVPLEKRAWHAGQSCFQDRQRCNDFSIGIELEGTDRDTFEDAQYDRLQEVTAIIRRLYPRITPERIVGHSDIAPGRKTDPGVGFDWQRFRHGLARGETEVSA